MNDCLEIVFDCNPPDKAVLVVGRKNPDKTINVISMLFGESAVKLYSELTNKKMRDNK